MTGPLHMGGRRPTPVAFERFHKENPRVYKVLCDLARDWIQGTGSHRTGMKALYEVARWQISIQTTDPDFKLSNDYTPYYARLLMYLEPDLDDLFVLRASDADAWLQTVIARGGII